MNVNERMFVFSITMILIFMIGTAVAKNSDGDLGTIGFFLMIIGAYIGFPILFYMLYNNQINIFEPKFGWIFVIVWLGTMTYWYLIGGGESIILLLISWWSLFIASLYGRMWAMKNISKEEVEYFEKTKLF